MSAIPTQHEPTANDPWGTPPIHVRLTESFSEVVAMNPELRIGQTANGEVVFLSPTGGESGHRNSEVNLQLGLWAKTHGGRVFDSSTLFGLPNGAKRSPDASWISSARWQSLSTEERKGYPPISPDFVLELRSESDRLVDLQEKMREYVENGVRLGWLIDPLLKQVHIYRPGPVVEVQAAVELLSGEECLPGFILDLRPIWAEI